MKDAKISADISVPVRKRPGMYIDTSPSAPSVDVIDNGVTLNISELENLHYVLTYHDGSIKVNDPDGRHSSSYLTLYETFSGAITLAEPVLNQIKPTATSKK